MLLGTGQWLVPRLHSRLVAVLFCLGLLGGLLWIVLMAVIDMMATKFHYSRQHQDYLIEQAKLRSELPRFQDKGKEEG